VIVGPLSAIGGYIISFRLAGCAWLLAGREEPRKRAKDILSLRPETHHGQYVGMLDISIAQRGPPRPAWTAAGRCPYGRYQVAQVANGHRRHLGPAADARKALSGAGGQWPPVTSRPGGGKLPPKDLEAGDW